VKSLAPPECGRPHVAMLAAGVCGTDIQIAARTRPDGAAVLGHEGVGVLRAAGERDRLVVFNPVDARNPDAVLGHSFDGVFRSWVPVSADLPVAALHEVEPLDPVALLALCEPLATVIYTWELIGSPPGPLLVGVWGAGPIGVLQTLMALDVGHEVAIVHPSWSRLRWLQDRRFGDAVRCLTAADGLGSQNGFGSRAGLRSQLDVAILCVPRPAMGRAAREAANALAPEGLMVLVPALDERAAALTFVDPGIGRVRWRNQCGCVDLERGAVIACTHEGKPVRVTGHRGTSLDQLAAAERLLRCDADRYASLITHRVHPDEAAALINARCAGRSRDDRGAEVVKVVIEFGTEAER
jgi:threonine dehydrogenase-like Zn-dependent dehydrogenase